MDRGVDRTRRAEVRAHEVDFGDIEADWVDCGIGEAGRIDRRRAGERDVGCESVAAGALLAAGESVEGAALDLEHVRGRVGDCGEHTGRAPFGQTSKSIGGQRERAQTGGGAINGLGDVVESARIDGSEEVERQMDLVFGGDAPRVGMCGDGGPSAGKQRSGCLDWWSD